MTPEALIEKYFTHGLTPEEQQTLDAYLEKHPDRAQAFAQEKDLQIALIDQGKDELRARLTQLHATTPSTQEEENSRRSFIKYAIAAAIIIGATLFAVKTYTPQMAQTDTLYAQYFEPYRNVMVPIERGQTNLTQTQKAFLAYEQEEYSQAAQSLKTLYLKNPDAHYLAFYQAIALMALQDYGKAITILNQYPSSDERFYSRSRWYLALAYLKNKNTTQAQSILKELAESQGIYKDKALALLDLL